MKPLAALIPLLITPGLALAFSFPKNTPYQVCFTPQHYCTGLIDDHIYAAKKSIYVQAYSFTSRSIAKALVRASAAVRHGRPKAEADSPR